LPLGGWKYYYEACSRKLKHPDIRPSGSKYRSKNLLKRTEDNPLRTTGKIFIWIGLDIAIFSNVFTYTVAPIGSVIFIIGLCFGLIGLILIIAAGK
jgi:hypothetical protein